MAIDTLECYPALDVLALVGLHGSPEETFRSVRRVPGRTAGRVAVA